MVTESHVILACYLCEDLACVVEQYMAKTFYLVQHSVREHWEASMDCKVRVERYSQSGEWIGFSVTCPETEAVLDSVVFQARLFVAVRRALQYDCVMVWNIHRPLVSDNKPEAVLKCDPDWEFVNFIVHQEELDVVTSAQIYKIDLQSLLLVPHIRTPFILSRSASFVARTQSRYYLFVQSRMANYSVLNVPIEEDPILERGCVYCSELLSSSWTFVARMDCRCRPQLCLGEQICVMGDGAIAVFDTSNNSWRFCMAFSEPGPCMSAVALGPTLYTLRSPRTIPNCGVITAFSMAKPTWLMGEIQTPIRMSGINVNALRPASLSMA